MEDDFPLDDAEFYDGLDEHDGRPGQAYQELRLPRWATDAAIAGEPAEPAPPIPSWLHPPADYTPPARLLTPEEFRAKLAAEGIILPDPE